MIVLVIGLTEVKQRIDSSEFEIAIETRLPKDSGTHIVTTMGHVIDVYDSGRALIQGRKQKQMSKILLR